MLQIIVLTDSLQGATKDLFEGFKIGATEDADLQIEQKSFINNDFIVECSSSGMFALYSPNKKPLIISGNQNLARIDLIPGLIFSINDIGFSIQENDQVIPVKENTVEVETLFKLFEDAAPPSTQDLMRGSLNRNLTFKFVRGLLLNKSWRIPWHPVSFGSKSSLLFFVDDFIPSTLDFLNISTKENDIFISSDIPNFVSLNSELLASGPKPLSDGDLIEFGQTAFYIELK